MSELRTILTNDSETVEVSREEETGEVLFDFQLLKPSGQMILRSYTMNEYSEQENFNRITLSPEKAKEFVKRIIDLKSKPGNTR